MFIFYFTFTYDLIKISFLFSFFIAEEELEKTNKILAEAQVEEDKRDIITREIGKFREIMKVSNSFLKYLFHFGSFGIRGRTKCHKNLYSFPF